MSLSMIPRLPDAVWADPEFGPALVVLDDPIVRGRVWFRDQGEPALVDLEKRTIDFDAIRARCHAASEFLLVGAAQAFWDGTAECTLSGLIHTLDDEPLLRVMLAIEVSRGWIDGHDVIVRLAEQSVRGSEAGLPD